MVWVFNVSIYSVWNIENDMNRANNNYLSQFKECKFHNKVTKKILGLINSKV